MRVKILFVCHGNICRSPMAAMVFRYLAQQRHVSGEFEVDSAALSSEEIGNGIYPPARRILVKHGVPCTEHRARQITPEDFETADLIIGMEWGHLKKLRALCPKEQDRLKADKQYRITELNRKRCPSAATGQQNVLRKNTDETRCRATATT